MSVYQAAKIQICSLNLLISGGTGAGWPRPMRGLLYFFISCKRFRNWPNKDIYIIILVFC